MKNAVITGFIKDERKRPLSREDQSRFLSGLQETWGSVWYRPRRLRRSGVLGVQPRGPVKVPSPAIPAGCPGRSPHGLAPSPSGREGHPAPGAESGAAWPSALPWKRWWGARFPLIKGPVHLQWIFSGVPPVIYAT